MQFLQSTYTRWTRNENNPDVVRYEQAVLVGAIALIITAVATLLLWGVFNTDDKDVVLLTPLICEADGNLQSSVAESGDLVRCTEVRIADAAAALHSWSILRVLSLGILIAGIIITVFIFTKFYPID